ncbi:MAG: DUF3800 domain-containing protein [Hyphomicrobiaceae bacterium]
MFAFVDETGNTGANLFDEDQPYFLTAALISKSDFDLVYGPSIQALCVRLGVPQLHANQLKPDQLDQAAQAVLRILKKADARFFVSRVEKKYLAATKLFDTIFDAGENKGVPAHIYNIRALRMMLMFRVATMLDYGIAKYFWSALMEPKQEKAQEMFVAVCEQLRTRVDQLPDQKTKKLVDDGLTWAIKHPDEIKMHSKGKLARYGHLPNMVAFGNLLDGLEKQSIAWNRPVRRITHDRQMQFETSLARWHELFSNASPDPIFLPGEKYVFQKVFGSEFCVSSADKSAGIQVTDLMLWILRRISHEIQISEECARLFGFAARRGYMHDFTFKHVSAEAERLVRRMLASEPDPVALQKAKEYIAQDEARRTRMLAEPEATKG